MSLLWWTGRKSPELGLGLFFLSFNLDYLFIFKCCWNLDPYPLVLSDLCTQNHSENSSVLLEGLYNTVIATTCFSKCNHLNAEKVLLSAYHLSSFIEELPVSLSVYSMRNFRIVTGWWGLHWSEVIVAILLKNNTFIYLTSTRSGWEAVPLNGKEQVNVWGTWDWLVYPK